MLINFCILLKTIFAFIFIVSYRKKLLIIYFCNKSLLFVYFLTLARHKEALSKHDQLTKDLQLTLDWNCPEIALTKVFYKDPTFKVI